MKLPIDHPTLNPKAHPELRELSKLVGDFIEYWGFKAVQGRLWFYLFVSEEPLSSMDLSQLLDVSAALVTQSVQVLIKYQVILTAEKGKNGLLRYTANPNVAEAISGVLASRESKMLEKIEAASHVAVRSIKKSHKDSIQVDKERLAQVGLWTGMARLMLEMGIENLNGSQNVFEQSPAQLKRSLGN